MTEPDNDIAHAGPDLHRLAIEQRLAALVRQGRGAADLPLHAAIDHALLSGGKRLRPRLVLAIAGAGEAALDVGCAVEMVHTASLILDDLPSMDDARLRRGNPTTHRRFGEATAILAAVALIAEAFEVVARLDLAAGVRSRLVALLSRSIGRNGMSAGQHLDLIRRAPDATSVGTLNALKTASLFAAAAEMAAVLRGMSDSQIRAVEAFARHFGQAFQLADDVLDNAASPHVSGKDVGADTGKATLDRVAGPQAARAIRMQHLQAADAALIRAGLDRAQFAPFIQGLRDQVPA